MNMLFLTAKDIIKSPLSTEKLREEKHTISAPNFFHDETLLPKTILIEFI